MSGSALAQSMGMLLVLPLSLAATTHYVSKDNATPAAPFTNWISAATNIQDAIDAATAGDLVLVSNGVYATAARQVYGMSNRVALLKPLTVQSVGGPSVTVISGSGPSGPAAVRCAYLTNGAVLVGFTLLNGAPASGGDIYQQASCGGAWCESATAVVSNCVLTGNDGGFAGGGAFQGTLVNCTIENNSAFLGGGAYSATLELCTLSNNSARYGGGAYSATLSGCILRSNVADAAGGGASGSTLDNCALLGNSADEGGGVYYGTLSNCTLTGNSAGYAGGASASDMHNCIAYHNTAPEAENTDADLPYGSLLIACCTTPWPMSGWDNLTNEPRFLDLPNADLRLGTRSPCINSGRNAFASGATDLAGSPRVAGGTVDVGAYEFQLPASIISYAWLQFYSLPLNGFADFLDPDSDHMSNWQEWMAGTDPTDPASRLRVQTLANYPPGILLRWTSDTNHAYFIQRAAVLPQAASFLLLQSDIPGLPGSTTFTDRTPPAQAAFYRVGSSPTNGISAAVLQPPLPVPANATLTWSSVTDRTYFVERATNVVGQPAFSLLASNLEGRVGMTDYADTNPPAGGRVFYRVGVLR